MPLLPTALPNRLGYKLLISFSLMSVFPILIGLYIASLFIKYPFQINASTLTLVSMLTLFSLSLSFLGYMVTKQLVAPISNVAEAAKNIASGKLDSYVNLKGVEELQDLSQSLQTISHNARELLEKVEKLSLKDKLTGLYNASYIRERLNEEIQMAIHYQHPCSFAYLVLQDFDAYSLAYGQAVSEEALKTTAKVLNQHLAQLDRAARLTKGEFALIFPDRNKKTAIEIVERICGELAATPLAGRGESIHLSVSIGISENPIDGVSAEELFIKAQNRAKAARVKGNNLIEAFA